MPSKVEISELSKLIGQVSGPSDWMTVEQRRINDFADATLDHQFIHVDEDKAKLTPFKGTIAHGMLSLSLIGHFAKQCTYEIENTSLAINYGFNKVRFLHPVPSSSKIRAKAIIIDVDNKGDSRYLITYQFVIEIENVATPALTAEWLVMVVLEEDS